MTNAPLCRRSARAPLAVAIALVVLAGCGDSDESRDVPLQGADPGSEPESNPGDAPDSNPDPTPDANPDTTPDANPDTTTDPNPDTTPDSNPDTTADPSNPPADPDEPPGGTFDDSAAFSPLPSDKGDVARIYGEDGYGTDDVVRVDVRTVIGTGPCNEDDESGCTLADIIADTDSADRFKPDIAVHFSADDFADDGATTNAELRQRGGFTRFAPQKSFRIKLDDKDAPWRDERTLQLNKHPYDNARMRNALSMELLASVPHLMGFRTQFVNLWLDDDGAGATDYGLFTHVEKPSKRWLERRGQDGDGQLYKASLFRFSADTRELMLTDEQGALLNESGFENRLDIENGDDHRAIGVVMDALHDPSRSFESVLDEHFNRNNLQAWLAMNILLHQREAISHNYLLHNPTGTERFYFVPWDYDATLATEEEPDADATDNRSLRKRLNYGYSRNKDNVVIRRFLEMPGAHERMLAAAEDLRTRYLTPERVSDRADAMAAVIDPWLRRLPDSEHVQPRDTPPGPDFLASIESNAEALRTRFAVPMAPTLLTPVIEPAQWLFAWTPAFEVTGSTLSYELQVSSSPGFQAADLIASVVGIADAPERVEQRIEAPSVPAGRYFVRVIARSDLDPRRFWQVADNVVTLNDQDWIGMASFTVP